MKPCSIFLQRNGTYFLNKSRICKLLYTFRVVSPIIIRSSCHNLQHLALVKPLLLDVVKVTGWKVVSIQSRSRQVAVTVSLMSDTVDTVT